MTKDQMLYILWRHTVPRLQKETKLTFFTGDKDCFTSTSSMTGFDRRQFTPRQSDRPIYFPFPKSPYLLWPASVLTPVVKVPSHYSYSQYTHIGRDMQTQPPRVEPPITLTVTALPVLITVVDYLYPSPLVSSVTFYICLPSVSVVFGQLR